MRGEEVPPDTAMSNLVEETELVVKLARNDPHVQCAHCGATNDNGLLFCSTDGCGRLLPTRLRRTPWNKKMGKRGGGHVECSICMETFRSSAQITFLPCLHAFHADCIIHWLSQGDEPKCPNCNAPCVKEVLSVE